MTRTARLMASWLFAAAAMFSASAVEEPRTAMEDGWEWTYKLDGGNAVIVRVQWGLFGHVTVPSSLDGHPVTQIGESAFSFAGEVESVVIPSSVTTIGPSAFGGLHSLTNVTLSSGLKTIEGWAFANCMRLTKIYIPDSVTEIGEGCFMGCAKLTTARLPPALKKISRELFCYGSYGSGLSEIEIPESVTDIDSKAFYSCWALKSIKLPPRLERIGEKAFRGAGLESLDLPDSVVSVGEYAFADTPLTSVKWSKGMKCIEAHSFADTLLTALDIPEGIECVGDGAFAGTPLESVSIANSVTNIDASAITVRPQGLKLTVPASITVMPYDWREYLTEIVFADSCTKVPANFLYVCQRLTTVKLPDTIREISTYAFHLCSSLQSIELPAGLTNIADHAFGYCSSLLSIALPDGLKRIDSCTFENCTALKEIAIPGSVESIYPDAFRGCKSLEVVHASLENEEIVYDALEKAGLDVSKIVISTLPDASVETTYVDAHGVTHKTNAAAVLSSDSRAWWGSCWYVVTNEVSLAAGAHCQGDVNLILADGAKLTATGGENGAGISVDGSLTIYGQRNGTGELVAFGDVRCAGIGGGAGAAGTNITINGGVVMAFGGYNAAGIGGSGGYAGSNITINGGVVMATGGEDGAGIGGGTGAAGTDITINGGVVTATGDYGSAGIGGGYYAPGANIFINGGTVTATGGVNGSGIGAGEASPTAASGIFAVVGMTVRAGASENPADVIPHTSSTTDIADALAYKRYVTAAGAAPAPTEFTVNGDVLSLGSGVGWTYDAGTKVLTLDGTAPVGAYALSGTKLDNSVSVDVSPATECRVTLTGVALGGPAATRNIIQVTKGTVCLDIADAVTFWTSNGHKAIGVSADATLRFTGSGTVDGWSVDVADGGRLVLEGIENVTFASEADAAAAAQYVPATRPNADVEKVVSAEDYAKMFTGAAVPSGTPGLWRVGHELTASVTNEIQQAFEAAETLGGLVGTVASDTPRTSVQTKAGLYYGMAGAAELGDLGAAVVPAGKWTLGDGTVREVTGEKPAGAAGSAFYRLKVTAKP